MIKKYNEIIIITNILNVRLYIFINNLNNFIYFIKLYSFNFIIISH